MSHESKVHQERTAEANTKRMSTRSYCQLLQWKVFFHTNRAVSVLCSIVSTEIIHHNWSRAPDSWFKFTFFHYIYDVMLHHVFNFTKTHPQFSSTAPPACPWPKLPLCDERNPWNWKLHEVPTNFEPCQWDFPIKFDGMKLWNGIRCHTCSFPCKISIFSNKAPWRVKGKLQVLQQCSNDALFAPQGQNPSEFSSLPRHLWEAQEWKSERIWCQNPENSRPRLGWSHPRARIISWTKHTNTNIHKMLTKKKKGQT